MLKHWFIFLFIYSISASRTAAQIKPTSSNEILLGLQKLNTLGSVLYFAAHPDDENTRLIAWLAQEKKYRTGYLSLTRGDGGQNLIGTEQGIDLGLIRTHELLAARSIDKGEQFFSSAYDFGFSKTHEETFSFWDKETALREAVWIIRKFQPDVIINRFPPDKRGGHGHHQASAILAKEAYFAAADPNMFPDQLKEVKPWQAKRLFWNTANFGGMNNTSEDQLKIDIGDYNPLLGQSYGEIAANSRSQHKSQGFGSASNRGQNIEYFDLVAGSKANQELLEGIDVSWKRVPNSEKIQKAITSLIQNFQPTHPQKSISSLFQLRSLIDKIQDNYWKAQKIKEIDQLILSCAGLWVEATAKQAQYSVNTTFDINLEAIVQNPGVSVKIQKVNARTIDKSLAQNILWKSNESYSYAHITQPYWLNLPHTLGKFEVAQQELGFPMNPNKPAVTFVFQINGNEIRVITDIQYKSVDPVQGERYQDISIAPSLIAKFSTDNIISVNGGAQKAQITFTRINTQLTNFDVHVDGAEGWNISPQSFHLNFEKSNTVTKEITLKPTSTSSKEAKLHFTWNNEILRSVKTIAYTHIPTITWFPIAEAKVIDLNISNPVKKVAYIVGAGDLIPQSLRQIGIETTILNEDEVSPALLKQFDAVIVGIRYFNISTKGEKITNDILNYVKDGGVALIQYNVNTRLSAPQIGPYPFTIDRNRVTEENAKIQFDTKDIALQYPNVISDQDFDNWVQERGLYFAENIDPQYRTPLTMHDKDEEDNRGSLLIATYGKGKFVYTSLAFFRQLPAGVPGAYRLFVNLLSKEK